MRLTKRVALVISFLLIYSHAIIASEIKLVSTVDKNVITSKDTISLAITISGLISPPHPNIPDLGNFSLIFGPSVSSSSTVINGVSIANWRFTYLLKPNFSGKHFIDAFTLRHNNKLYKSNTVVVDVVDSRVEEKKQNPQKPIDIDDLVFVDLTADKYKGYITEQIILSFKLFYKRGLTVANIKFSEPHIRNAIIEDLGQQRNYQVMRDGLIFNVVELRKIIFPVISGEIIIEPIKLGCSLILKRTLRGGHGFFSDPYNDTILNEMFDTRRDRIPITCESKKISLSIKQLPEKGKPADFKGSVGSYSFDVDLEPTVVNAGDPITLTMSVIGEGNIKAISEPVLHLLNDTDFKVYPSEVTYSQKKNNNGLTGIKIFSKVIEPQTYKIKKTPGISFSYFNSALDEYKTISYNPVPISVIAPAFEKPLHYIKGIHNLQEKMETNIISKDILPIMTNLTTFNHRLSFLYKNPHLVPLLLIPIMLLVFSLFFQRYRRRLKDDSISNVRNKRLQTTTIKMLVETESIANEIEPEKIYAIISKTLSEYLACKLETTTFSIEPNRVENLLHNHGLSNEAISKLIILLELCDYGRFACDTDSSKDVIFALTSAIELIKEFEKQLT